MSRRIIAAILALTLSGCYHVTVTTGAPAAPQVIDRPWQLSWVYGLVPPPAINVSQDCPQGVARVETERSLLNSLVTIAQSIILIPVLTPMHATVTCASGPVQD
jgi:hypothetical protein